MRLDETYNAQKTTDYSYTWGGTAYTNILIRDTLGANTRVTTSQSLTMGNGTDATTTITWILPHVYKRNTYLDGITAGSIRIKVSTGANPGSPWFKFHFDITVQSIDSSGVATTLGTLTTAEGTTSTVPSGQSLTIDVPFWIDTFKKLLPYNTRLALKIVYHLYCQSSDPFTETGYAEMALNSADTYIRIPYIP